MQDYLALIERHHAGPRNDVTPLFADHSAFSALVEDLVKPFRQSGVQRVAGIDALGFILGTAVAMSLGVGFIAIRKAGKLPSSTKSATFVDYSGDPKSLEMRTDVFPTATRVLLVDEWAESGSQLAAAARLLENCGAELVGIATINMDINPQTTALRQAYKCHSILANGAA